MTDAFVRHRLKPIILAITRNLKRLSQDREARTVVGVSGSACVIGGGPSCGGFDRIEEGVALLAVNTSGPRVCKERSPDIICVREVVPVDEQLRNLKHPPKLVVLDIGVAQATVDAAYELAPVAWAIPAQQHLAWLIRLLDVVPFYSGESALTMTVSFTQGCETVGMVGCDFAFGRAGEMYGDGTAWGGTKGTDVGFGVVDMGNRGGMQEIARKANVAVPMLREQTTPIIREDGSEGQATATWVSQRQWVEQWAQRHPETRFVNLSGGARIKGVPPGDGVSGQGAVLTKPLDTSRIDEAIRRQLVVAKEMEGNEAPWLLGAAFTGAPLVELAAQPQVVETMQRGLPMRLALQDRGPIMREAIEAVSEAWNA